MLLIFAGPNGSGKSTITEMFEIIGKYTNADDLVKQKGISNLYAAKLVEEMRNEYIRLNEDFTFETVLSNERYINLIKKAKAQGYFIKVIYVITRDPSINVNRVNCRVSSGGHDVPIDKIVSRYYKSLANIKEVYKYCDILHVYDNTEVAQRIFRKHKNEPIMIFENEYWSYREIQELINI